MEKLHQDSKLKKKDNFKNIADFFGSLVDKDDFLKWLEKGLKYKLCRL